MGKLLHVEEIGVKKVGWNFDVRILVEMSAFTKLHNRLLDIQPPPWDRRAVCPLLLGNDLP